MLIVERLKSVIERFMCISSFQISRIIVLESCITSPSIFTYGLILRRGRPVAFLSDMHFFFREIGCSCREIYALVLLVHYSKSLGILFWNE